MNPDGVGRSIATQTFDAQRERGFEHGRGLLLTSPSMEGAAADLAPLGRFARTVSRRPGGPRSSRARPPVVASWFTAPGS